MQRNRDGSGHRGIRSGGYIPRPSRLLPNFSLQQHPNTYNLQNQHNLNFPQCHPQNPSFLPHQFNANANVFLQPHGHHNGRYRINATSENPSSKPTHNVDIARIDKAVEKTRRSLATSGESVSSTRLLQLVSAQLHLDSFGIAIHDVPSFRKLMTLEGNINAFIHCFIGATRITTLHDLEVAICRNEVVDCFDDLELGPLLQHPLVLLYFPSVSGSTSPVQITSEEIISFLDSYLDTYDTEDFKLDEFLTFVAEKKSVTSHQKLGVRIQSLRMYVSFIQDIKREEGETLEISLAELRHKCRLPSSKKQRQDKAEGYDEDLHRGKDAGFSSSSSDDDDSDDYEIQYVNSSDRFGSCPYPSANEEMKRHGSSNKKRKAESRNRKKSDLSKSRRSGPSKLGKGHVKQETPKSADDSDVKKVFDVNEDDITRSEEALRLFLSTWKDTCKELSMTRFVEKVLSFYNLGGSEVQPQIKRAKAMSSFPFVGLLHIAKALVREALEDPIPTKITDTTKSVAGYDTSAGTSSGANKPNPLHPMPEKSGSMSENPVHEWNHSALTDYNARDHFHTGTPWATQALQTGKKGEEIAYRYFAAKHGNKAVVRWVNEQSETGLPYDLVIESRGGKKEYIEVKATVSTGKDYFNLTVKEWQFANEKGESYVIAHVLLGNSNAILTQHRNLVKLCHEGHLRLLILMPNQQNAVKVAF